MRSRPERILLFRSGRHLRVALDALRAASPGCDLTVVATPPAAPVLDQAGVDQAHRIVYERTPFFEPLPFLTSRAGARALAGRFDRVCVLWNDQDGAGQANVDQCAALVSLGGFTAITPDGRLIPWRIGTVVAREIARAATSIGVAAALGLLLFAPARILGRLKPAPTTPSDLAPATTPNDHRAAPATPLNDGRAVVGSAFRRTNARRASAPTTPSPTGERR